jgi:hypothetical protein
MNRQAEYLLILACVAAPGWLAFPAAFARMPAAPGTAKTQSHPAAGYRPAVKAGGYEAGHGMMGSGMIGRGNERAPAPAR